MESRGSRIEMKQRSWRVEVEANGESGVKRRRAAINSQRRAATVAGKSSCQPWHLEQWGGGACHVVLVCHATTSRRGVQCSAHSPHIASPVSAVTGWYTRSNWQLNFPHPGLDRAEAALHKDCRDFRWWDAVSGRVYSLHVIPATRGELPQCVGA